MIDLSAFSYCLLQEWSSVEETACRPKPCRSGSPGSSGSSRALDSLCAVLSRSQKAKPNAPEVSHQYKAPQPSRVTRDGKRQVNNRVKR